MTFVSGEDITLKANSPKLLDQTKYQALVLFALEKQAVLGY